MSHPLFSTLGQSLSITLEKRGVLKTLRKKRRKAREFLIRKCWGGDSKEGSQKGSAISFDLVLRSP